jgi:N-methylhydantoinase B
MTRERDSIDGITLEVLRHAFTAVADEMNANLIRSAYSPNIKERRDCSSALFDAAGQMVAQADSIPVHLGAMPYSVAAALQAVESFRPGDVVVLNDPYAGGAHLPDITFVAPVFAGDRPVAFVANRAHHADVGGKEPGSLSGDTVEIYQEGLRIPPIRLWRGGDVNRDLLDLILLNVRTPEERWGDLRAQHAACVTGIERLGEVIKRYGVDQACSGMAAILDYSECRMRTEIARMPDGTAEFSDVLDDDGVGNGPIPIRVSITVEGDRIAFDFTGTAKQVRGPVNAVIAVTSSATLYAVRAVTDPEIPPNAGSYRPVNIIAPPGSVVNPDPPAPVVGGNLETSQRIVDVILGAMAKLVPDRAIAACQGSMNNLAIGGTNPRTGGSFSIYETIGGGVGGRPDKDGIDGVHSHMTNTLNTPIEALEIAYPLRVERYQLRCGSGGAGRFRGGLGIRRDIRSLCPDGRVSLLTERRASSPYGLAGGQPGQSGENVLIRDDEEIALPAKGSISFAYGEIISIRTPGGGGYGRSIERDPASVEADRREERV